MSNQRFSPEFKDEAVRQIVDRGYSVAEVSERLGVSAHSLYKWVKAVKPDKTNEQAAALRSVSSNPANRTRMRLFSGSTRATGTKCSIPISSQPWDTHGKSPKNGKKRTTNTDLMMPLGVLHQRST